MGRAPVRNDPDRAAHPNGRFSLLAKISRNLVQIRFAGHLKSQADDVGFSHFRQHKRMVITFFQAAQVNGVADLLCFN